MKAIILTIRLKYFYLTYKGIKTIEVRKSCPKDFVGDVYECVSKTNWKKDLLEIPEKERDLFKQFVGKVGLKFTLNEVEQIEPLEEFDSPMGLAYKLTAKKIITCQKAQLTYDEYNRYLKGKKGYAWHIDNLEIFDKPKELGEFKIRGEYKCPKGKCPYYGTSECRCASECLYEKPLTKAPQSWCYVEI